MPYSDPEKAKECKRRWAEKNRDKINAKHREKYATDPEFKAKSLKYYEDHKEEILEDRKEYYQENREEKLKYAETYRAENIEKIREYFRLRSRKIWSDPELRAKEIERLRPYWINRTPDEKKDRSDAQKARYWASVEKYRAMNRDRYAKDPEKYRRLVKESRMRDPVAYAKYIKQYHKNRMDNDIQYNMLIKLRDRLRQAIKRGYKSDTTRNLIGCDLEQLVLHFESLFTEGMSWELVMSGDIQIDHVRPLSSFDLMDPDQQKKASHYTNLQPLWEFDNKSKGDRWDGGE